MFTVGPRLPRSSGWHEECIGAGDGSSPNGNSNKTAAILCRREVKLTIASWLIFGIAAGLLFPTLMPTPVSYGRIPPIIVGIIGSMLGGALGAYFMHSPLEGFINLSTGIAVNVAFYVLFTYQCVQTVRSGRKAE